ncbi:MAG TPA: hypothetical protein DIT13_05485 [Verrucomicrobiales bacterium]|nr:hypothetical protein [Verrucomicrobiales bacterium]
MADTQLFNPLVDLSLPMVGIFTLDKTNHASTLKVSGMSAFFESLNASRQSFLDRRSRIPITDDIFALAFHALDKLDRGRQAFSFHTIEAMSGIW